MRNIDVTSMTFSKLIIFVKDQSVQNHVNKDSKKGKLVLFFNWNIWIDLKSILLGAVASWLCSAHVVIVIDKRTRQVYRFFISIYHFYHGEN